MIRGGEQLRSLEAVADPKLEMLLGLGRNEEMVRGRREFHLELMAVSLWVRLSSDSRVVMAAYSRISRCEEDAGWSSS